MGGAYRTLLQVEFLDAVLVWSNGCALDAHGVLENGIGGIDSDLIVGLVTVGQAQVVVLQVYVEVWENELLLDVCPYNARHLVAVELDDWILDLDLGPGFGGCRGIACLLLAAVV